ncbi:hypothetical protein [Siminovitchia fordii]|uniref:hypothetical protein n=1 Tax=Siminovitchia fordii TaxID=254759 RepID=UPI00146E9D58|nr:hypothetical protein [Siminovitchia fordii]
MVVRLHILPFFGRKKVLRIRRSDIQKWMNHYFEIVDDDGNEEYSYGSRLRYLSVLKSIFHYGFTNWRYWRRIRQTNKKYQ